MGEAEAPKPVEETSTTFVATEEQIITPSSEDLNTPSAGLQMSAVGGFFDNLVAVAKDQTDGSALDTIKKHLLAPIEPAYLKFKETKEFPMSRHAKYAKEAKERLQD